MKVRRWKGYRTMDRELRRLRSRLIRRNAEIEELLRETNERLENLAKFETSAKTG